MMRLIDPLTTVHGTLAHHGLPAALWRRRPETNVPSGRRDVLLFSITVETSQTESLSLQGSPQLLVVYMMMMMKMTVCSARIYPCFNNTTLEVITLLFSIFLFTKYFCVSFIFFLLLFGFLFSNPFDSK